MLLQIEGFLRVVALGGLGAIFKIGAAILYKGNTPPVVVSFGRFATSLNKFNGESRFWEKLAIATLANHSTG